MSSRLKYSSCQDFRDANPAFIWASHINLFYVAVNDAMAANERLVELGDSNTLMVVLLYGNTSSSLAPYGDAEMWSPVQGARGGRSVTI